MNNGNNHTNNHKSINNQDDYINTNNRHINKADDTWRWPAAQMAWKLRDGS